LGDVCQRLGIGDALDRFGEVGEGRTMDLAWFLAGLAHAGQARPECAADLRSVAVKTCRLLKKNQGKHGFFGHMARNRSFAGLFRGSAGSFADQVYPIYALSRFGSVYAEPSAIDAARNAANAICRAQGQLGQWWWHYDAAGGHVFEQYPVYSVHQHGMAPMALFALEEATGLDFGEPIYRGLRWVVGQNELARDLRDGSSGVIWRSFYHVNKISVYRDRIHGIFRRQRTGSADVEDLAVKRECRPYELGWLLYAFAGRVDSNA
jgi:hypothetical protein